jgi:ADP-heptose:LPS heptosyltransferase
MNLLVMRFSAMGDVALLAPALIAIAANYPNVQITLVTRGNFTPFFYNIPNVNVIGINLKKYKGIIGIWKFYKELEKLGPYDKIIDLHSSLRSRAFSFIYKFRKIPTFTINKGRKEKKEQIRRKNKILKNPAHKFLNQGLR